MPFKKEKTDILISSKDSVRRLLRIITITKDDKFYEYKISLHGFKGLNFYRNASLCRTSGEKIGGELDVSVGQSIEASYHADGTLNFKDTENQQQIEPKHHYPPISKLKKSPILIFKISGLELRSLEPAHKHLANPIEIELPEYEDIDYINIDFYISNLSGNYGFKLTKLSKNLFLDSLTYLYKDEKYPIQLGIFIYRFIGKKGHTFFNIPGRGLKNKIGIYSSAYKHGRFIITILDDLLGALLKRWWGIKRFFLHKR